MKLISARFEPRRARIELVPMIDTMVFLLVFFMIASLAMTRQKGLPVALPNADSAQKATWTDRAIVVTASEDGSIYLDKTAVEHNQLSSELSARLAINTNKVVVINADKQLRHQRVVWLMDEARKAGATNLAIATDGKFAERIGEESTEK